MVAMSNVKVALDRSRKTLQKHICKHPAQLAWVTLIKMDLSRKNGKSTPKWGQFEAQYIARKSRYAYDDHNDIGSKYVEIKYKMLNQGACYN